MLIIDNPVAEFRQSIYKDGFGFDVTVYEKADNVFYVNSAGLLDETYDSIEAFFEDLILKNPLWFTYYFVRIDISYKQIAEAKLKGAIDNVFNWLDHSMICSHDNWKIGDNALNDFIQDTIKETIVKYHRFGFLKVKKSFIDH